MKTCKEKNLLQQVLARRGKEEESNTTQPSYVVSANIALAKKHYIYCIVDIVFTSIKCV